MSAKKSPSARNASKAVGPTAKRAGGKSKSARKPATAKAAVSARTDPATPPRIRLQRALAAAGFGSRRQCEELIVEGRVVVDGQVVDQLGATIDERTAKIFVDGTPLKPRRLIYYAVNKPTGVVTTNADPEGRPRVIDLVPPDERVFPVGRLDRSSEGLILLTNDGDLAQRLAHPRYEIQKVYRVTVAGHVQSETIRQMQQGIYIAEGLVRVEGAKVLKARSRATEMEITLKEGKNREIRRILARLGHKVQSLRRIAIGPLRLGEMPAGAYRRLSAEEIKKLKQATEPTARTAQGTRATQGVSPGGRPRPSAGGKKRPSAPAAGRTGKVVGGSRPHANTAGGGRPGKPRVTKTKTATPPALPDLSGPRTGAVIGADPAVVRDKTPTPLRSKDHIVRPRPARKASGSKRPTPGRAGKPRATGRRKKGS